MYFKPDDQQQILAFTQELVQIPSLSGEEEAVAQLVEAQLKSMDFDDVHVDGYGSVVGIRQGEKPGGRVLFDAHIDTVPVKNPELWSHDPFGGELSEGKIWGRGATDIKGGLAGMVIALGRMPRDAFRGTLILSASVGEELIEGAALQKVMENTHPDGVVIIEPTQCRLGIAQKGRAGFWVNTTGRAAHTSHPEQGENAIYKAVDVIQRLRDLPLPEDPVLGKGVMELIEIQSSPFPGECTVPYACRLRFDRRLVEGETQASVQASIEDALSSVQGWQFGFNQSEYMTYTGQMVSRLEFHPGWAMEETSPWVLVAMQGLAGVGMAPTTFAAPYCTNGSYSRGILQLPTLIFGPSHTGLAHIVDEYVLVAELLHAAEGLVGLATSLPESFTNRR